MKKYLFLICATCICCDAHAALTKCFMAGGISSCTAMAPASNTGTDPDWAIKCTDTDGTTIQINGISTCATYTGDSVTELSVQPEWDSNNACYCRALTPFVSNWIMVQRIGGYTNCMGSCSNACRGAMTSASNRELLFTDYPADQ